MRNPIRIIKSPAHLDRLFLDKEGLAIFSEVNSSYVYSFLENSYLLSQSEITFKLLSDYLNKLRFERVDSSNAINLEEIPKYEFSLKGDTYVINLPGYEYPIKFEFFGEELEKFYLFDVELNTKVKDLKSLILSDFKIEDPTEIKKITILNPEIDAQKYNRYIFSPWINASEDKYYDSGFAYAQLYYSRIDLLEKEISTYVNNNYQIRLITSNLQELPIELAKFVETKFNVKTSDELKIKFYDNLNEVSELNAGFINENDKTLLLTDRELYGSLFVKREERTSSQTIKKLLHKLEGDIQIGDFVVHEDYGVGIYAGLTQEEVENVMHEYLQLKYAGSDELLVPVNQVEKITKYIGNVDVPPKLTKLGGVSWEATKERVKKSTKILARELIAHFAHREIAKAKPVPIANSDEYQIFIDNFKHNETDDQIRAINEITNDLSKDKPMNRILIGDVGFGKTEVFLRAAFRILENGGQVAILAPTTILAAQHYALLIDRFKDFKYKIGYLSRFNTPQENSKIVEDLNTDQINIVVGTHRLLSNDVKFKNLQLLIVDEEQKFGVKQKETIKKLNYATHVLYVSATPIPRTLSMALSTFQDISIIAQPPKNRKPIKTEIIKNNWAKVHKCIRDEITRGGQIYFVHNEVQSIFSVLARLEKEMPDVRFCVGHGQMTPSKLDKVMSDFYLHKYDCLIATTIIENGLDISNVNTIIINKADRLGLSQIYQLRGRVGRSGTDAYCYLLIEGANPLDDKYKDLDQETKKVLNKKYIERLNAIVENQDLGAGFRIASKDLEIRGAGNILGDQQSGYISTIGYGLYIQILATEVEKLKKDVNIE